MTKCVRTLVSTFSLRMCLESSPYCCDFFRLTGSVLNYIKQLAQQYN